MSTPSSPLDELRAIAMTLREMATIPSYPETTRDLVGTLADAIERSCERLEAPQEMWAEHEGVVAIATRRGIGLELHISRRARDHKQWLQMEGR